MKKILLTLFAVAAVFVACDKDNLDQDITNINVLEQAEEINASVDIDFDSYKNQLESLMGIIVKEGTPKSTTRRGGDNGDNWIELSVFNGTGSDSNAIFAHAITDGNALVCYDGFTYNGNPVVPATYSFDDDGVSPTVGLLTIEVAGQVTPYEISGSLRTTYIASFGNSFDSVFRVALTSNNGFAVSGDQPQRGDFTFSSCGPAPITWDVPAASANGIGTYTSSNGKVYVISAAPFPLTGFLATTSDSGSANYAGTTIADVRAAIEADLLD